MTEETNVFDEAEVSEEMPTEELDIEMDPADNADNTPFAPTISSESPAARKERLGEKKEMDGKTLTIKEVFHTRPKTRAPDGSTIPPKKTQDDTKAYYPGKLGIRFEEDNLVEYYPNFKYYLNEQGQVSTFAKIWREGTNSVSEIFKLVVAKLGKPVDEVSDQEVYEYLVGKKVVVKTAKGTYMGKPWFRNDIVSIK